MRYIIVLVLVIVLQGCKVYTIDASTLTPDERARLIDRPRNSFNILYDPYYNNRYNDLWWYNNNWRYNNNINIFKYNKYGNNTRNVNPSRGSRGAGTSVNRQPNRPKTKQAPPTRLPQRHKGRGKKQDQ